jgi:plastocyanin
MRSAPALAALALAVSACSGGDRSVTQPGSVTPILTTLGVRAPGNTLAIGGTMQLSASPKDQNGVPFQTVVTWGSGSSFVATITSGGLVTGVAGGQAYMFAHGGSLTDSTLITVLNGAYPSSAAVYMLPLEYSPVQTDIAVGGVVQFVFPSLAHNVFFRPTPAGAPADIPGEVSNQTVPRTFNTKGTFTYDCTIHPGMTATIVVH